MGKSISFINDELIIATKNKNIDEISKLECLTEQVLFEHTNFKNIELALALDSFNKFTTYKLKSEKYKQNLSTKEIGEFISILYPLKKLHSDLINGPDAENYVLDLSKDEKKLYLCGCKLVELNQNICKLHKVTIVQACCNYLKFLPYGVGQMKQLRVLGLSKNQLEAIPSDVGYLKELRELDLANNRISYLPKALSCLKKLNTLKIEGNLFTEIPSFLGKIHSLKLLNISFNKLKSIPFEIFKLPFLMNLNTTGCELKARTIKKFEEVNKLTLQETISRCLIRRNHRVNKSITKCIVQYIITVKECCFCGGPFFDYFINVEDNHTYESEVFPIHYKMCSRHYKEHEERITTLFERSLKTFPMRLYEENLPPVGELFEPCSYEWATLEDGFFKPSIDLTTPLVSLVVFNQTKQHSIEDIFEFKMDDLNCFDKAFSV